MNRIGFGIFIQHVDFPDQVRRRGFFAESSPKGVARYLVIPHAALTATGSLALEQPDQQQTPPAVAVTQESL